MIRTLKLLVALCTLLQGAGLLSAWLQPVELLQTIGVSLDNASEVAFVRADLGGMMLSFICFSLLALGTGRRYWLLAAVILRGSILCGRLAHLLQDGSAGIPLRPATFDIMVLLLYGTLYRLLSTVESSNVS